MKRIITLLWLAVSVLLTTSTAQSVSDLKFEIRSTTGSNRFQLGEVVPLELVFSSTSSGRYLEPCVFLTQTCFGYPQCRFANQWKWTITPEDGWTDLQHPCATMSGPTFVVEDHDLGPQPKTIPYELTQRFRFDKTGKYTVRLEMNIGLDDDSNPRFKLFERPNKVSPADAVHHSVNTVASFELEIVAADPQWQSDIIRKGIAAYSRDEPPRTEPLTPEFISYQKDTAALCELGTPDAARALAGLMLREHPRVQGCLERLPSVDAAIIEMERLITDPDAAITPGFFTELVILRNSDNRKPSGYAFLKQNDIDLERQRLIDALPRKHPDALVTSLIAVLRNPPMSPEKPGEQKYPLPFPDSVIAMTAANFERFPREEQEWLLRDSWDLVRSPLMLPALRSAAENHVGYAVLRWQELDPGTANEFIKKEILSPTPRYSSFYLRLPRPLAANEEQQLAANFVALAERYHSHQIGLDHDYLVRVASFLHRYGTRAVLPSILPVIDAQRGTWTCAISYPVLAYLLKVSPDAAASRVEDAIAKANHGPCDTVFFFTELGVLEHGSVLERLAFAQLSDQPGSFARNAAEYLRLYASANAKARVWERLQGWQRRWAVIEQKTDPQKFTLQQNEIRELAEELKGAFTRAQAWILTPEDENRLRVLLGEKGIASEACRFSCGAELAISKPAPFAIYQAATERDYSRPYVLDYLNNPSPHRFAIRQYSCPDLKTLEDKLLQFPVESSFQFTWDFTARDRDVMVEIAAFLRSHGYKVDNPQQWNFLSATP